MRADHDPCAKTLRLALALMIVAAPCFAQSLSVQVDPPEPKANEPFVLSVTIADGVVDKIDLPRVDGLDAMPGVSSTTYAFTGGSLVATTARKYQLVAGQPGDFTIPPFEVTLKGGNKLRSSAIKFHVAASDEASAQAPAQNSSGPVVMPPTSPQQAANATQNSSDTTTSGPPVPRDKDGSPARVFMVITTASTQAYVGELVPLRIDFYIRQEANADQDSLPTIKGSNFLMNDFAVRGHQSLALVEGMPYECDTFLSAIAAPKSGDFPLASERDTYWTKAASSNGFDPLGFTRNANLAHGIITSNEFTMHILPLPETGRPENFTGAVGQFAISSDAQPPTIAMGEPATLTFDVTGTGNFDYVHCPVLTTDPHWKTYSPTSRIRFTDEQRTQGTKTFEQLVIPQENGNVPLPSATFSYFNTRIKQYVSVPIHLPIIAVTGAMPIAIATTTPTEPATAAPAPAADAFSPNRTELGELDSSMVPAYRQPWFWIVQASLLALPLMGLLVLLVRYKASAGRESSETILWRRSLRQEQNAMAEAVRQGNALAFFVAARHAAQLQLSARWAVAPEAITLGEIRRRDPALGETLEPFFAQADEVIYSGHANTNLDLAHWHRIAHELLEPQAA